MGIWHRKKHHSVQGFKNNRISIIIAIVFLLGLACIYKLFDLQVKKYDLYTALASGQHQISNILEPKRGGIYISNYNDTENKLYPYATNKDFALVYAIPKDITDAERISEILYNIFKKEEVEQEVEELLQEQYDNRLKKDLDFIATFPEEERASEEEEARAKHEALKYDNDFLEIQQIKRDAEIELRHDKIIEEYLTKLTKENDPYEPIEKKVDEDTLKRLYASIMSSDSNDVSPDELAIKEGRIYRVSDSNDKAVELEGISHTMVNYRYYPENNIGSHLLGFVNSFAEIVEGRYGLEGFFNQELTGIYGSIKSGRSADKSTIIIQDREYVKPQDGSDLILTVDRSIQFEVCRKLNETAVKYDAEGGSVIIMIPQTGEILAMCSTPDYDPNKYDEVEDIKVFNNPAIFAQYEPGSVMKTITMAASINENKITPDTTYVDEGFVMIEGWPKPIKNSDYESHGGWGEVNMNVVLEESLNTGAIFAMEKIGGEKFSEYMKNFGFNEKTGIELETEEDGNISNLLADYIKPVDAAVASFGQGMTTTPLQLVTAYNTIANGGILMKPYIVKEIIRADGSRDITKPIAMRRVISERTSILLTGMLVNVVEGGHAKLASVDGYYVGGKTGTAQVASSDRRGYGDRTIHTFIGFAPANEPKFTILVKLDNPTAVRFSASSAAPLFGEIAKYLLNYLEIPKER